MNGLIPKAAARLIAAVIVFSALPSCRAVPILDETGAPVIDPDTGQPAVEYVADAEMAAATASTVATVLPPPWNLAIPAAAGLAFAFFPRKKATKPTGGTS